ncbi:MAG TPA: cupin domain-containing protein [Microvirga sp.]|nr:cupin domain-containing protein [Microvirga sp.]
MAQAKGYGDPRGYNAPLGTETYVFQSNGIVPNNPLPLIVRRGAVSPAQDDPPRAFKTTFAKNGWTNVWLDTIHDYHHYHPNTHEVLGVVSGSASVRFGGEDGELVAVSAGDVVIIPAGVAHALINASDDFAVVGAYPDGHDYDTVRDDPGALASSRQRIPQVPLPNADPVDGVDGPLMKLWPPT